MCGENDNGMNKPSCQVPLLVAQRLITKHQKASALRASIKVRFLLPLSTPNRGICATPATAVECQVVLRPTWLR
ncbi:hypothetical protein BC938DRAFT_471800 [Jimgerdemannia flammicorona]|uniref:Uncharacterized protein n=1 Tax=Jimgerdemannia flammicorona TaxID=994334 RepID=A0A433Q7D0_9FUNG|nr:hypothetical protein BC938DRAFT_471800 [Jimgerdemannia flammicorona]